MLMRENRQPVEKKERQSLWRRWSPEGLEHFYRKYNRREYVHPDPLEFLYAYPDVRDREIVGLIASSLAYGRVEQILAKTRAILEKMGPPRDFIEAAKDPQKLEGLFGGFKHRFTTGRQLSFLFENMRAVLRKWDTLGECLLSGYGEGDENILPALGRFVSALWPREAGIKSTLLPPPEKGSACKRLNLYLRWMVRHDDVDPGGWGKIPASKLIVPLDTHLHRLSLELGLTARRQADMRTAIEITRAFGEVCPEDPVRYDFTLTRPGIKNDRALMEFLFKCLKKEIK
ncbi:MAG: TIGR02757 family protein [Nitrospiraceae bacterium]|nr:TIGR02757 family protein [Nitrospiraceae bacterium]